MTVIKFLCSSLILGGLIYLALLTADQGPVLIQSIESKTIEGGPVFNEIAFFSESTQDIWMMNQSHHGMEAEKVSWDRLAILIDKKSYPKKVSFLQLPPGDLVWDENLKNQKIDFKVSCFMCHSNGPRAIRANYEEYKTPLLAKFKIALWNLRIKTYGLLEESEEHLLLDQDLAVPFRHRLSADNLELQVKSCTKCHNGEDEWFSRNKLTSQNIMTIQFMVENELMPPPGHSVSEKDRKELEKFMRGI